MADISWSGAAQHRSRHHAPVASTIGRKPTRPVSDLVSIRDRVRFTGPTSTSATVKRTRLDARFESAVGQVVRVLAPAGYGKSTLVARWVASDERNVCWLDLEPIDDDPLVFGQALVNALADHRAADHDPGLDRPHGAPFDEVAGLVGGLHDPFVLVLDDIHHLVSEDSTHLIGVLIDSLPPDSTIVLAGRAHHRAEWIARHRLHPGVVDVGINALAFDLAETEQLLTLLGIEPDIDLVTAIADQFEGWPAGVRLAGQAMAMGRSTGEVASSRLGDLTDVIDYVTAEWFGGLSDEDQSFLTEAGCLGRFTGEQCDAVLGRRGSASILHRLCHKELLVIALDQQGQWYRMHAVLSRWLAARLRRLDPDRWREIHLAAARWWSLQADIDLAVEHAAAANDLDLLEELVILHSGNYATRGMFHTIERWMRHFDDTRVRGSLALRHVMAVLAVGSGDGDRAVGWMRLSWADHVPIDHAVSSISDLLAYQTDALFATLETRSAIELIPAAKRAHRHLPPGAWRGLACLALGANLKLCGDEGAEDLLREALFEVEVAHSTTLQATAASALAIALDLDGKVDEASELVERAVRLLATPLGEDSSATALALAGASLVAVRSGRHDEAAARFGAARRKLAGFDRCAPWFNILGLIPLIRTSLLLDDAAAAHELLRQLDQKMQDQDGSTPLARRINELGDAVHTASELFSERSWSLTAAELRVAQLLPTNLSLADIAGRLYVSRNTVKSHAAAIYRKLGTNSRAEAVDRLRSAGTLTEM